MTESYRKVLSLVILSLCVVLLAGRNFGQKIKIKNEEGVQVVYNPRNPAPPPGSPEELILTEDLRIGDIEAEEFLFSEISSIEVDEKGNIYVLDSREANIKVFDESGRHIRTFGTRGQGPGELQMPGGMCITPDEEILILDTANRRLLFFTLLGKYLRELSIGKYMFARVFPDSKGNLIGQFIVFAETPFQEITKFDAQLNPRLTLTKMVDKSMDPRILTMVHPILGLRVMRNDRIVWGISSEYAIFIVSPEGKRLRKILKDSIPQRIPEDRVEEWKGSLKGKVLPAGARLEAPKHYPAYSYFICGDDSRLYVKTYETDPVGNVYCDVFDAEGRYVVKFAVPGEEIISIVSNKRLYSFIRENKEGLPIVKRYSMEWR